MVERRVVFKGKFFRIGLEEEIERIEHGHLGDEIHFLNPGDAIWYPSTTPHRMENVADEPTEYIWIDTPKSF